MIETSDEILSQIVHTEMSHYDHCGSFTSLHDIAPELMAENQYRRGKSTTRPVSVPVK